jgi:hypothetical protein
MILLICAHLSWCGMLDMVQRFLQLEDLDLFQYFILQHFKKRRFSFLLCHFERVYFAKSVIVRKKIILLKKTNKDAKNQNLIPICNP